MIDRGEGRREPVECDDLSGSETLTRCGQMSREAERQRAAAAAESESLARSLAHSLD